MIVEESNRYGYCKRQKVIAYTKCMCDIKQCKGNNISTHIMIFLASVDASVVLYGHHPTDTLERSWGQRSYQSWRQITLEDVKAFLGFSILMGINIHP